jgi:general secretion pathway protein M
MMLRRGSLLSRVLATSLLLVVLWLCTYLVVLPVISAYRTTAEEVAHNRALLDRYRALAAEQPRYARRLEERLEAYQANTGFLQGQDETLAAAALQERVGSVIDAAGGELRSTQILPSQVVDEGLAIRRAGLRLQFAVAIEGLEEILYELETAEPYLFVDDINIREQRTRRRRNEGPSETSLDVSLEVYGFVRGEAEEPAAATLSGSRQALARRGRLPYSG